MKPGVTFFGEKLSNHVSRTLNEDAGKCDLVIVIGTSLSVAPMSRAVGFLGGEDGLPVMLINRNQLSAINEIGGKSLLGNSDDVVAYLEGELFGDNSGNSVVEPKTVEEGKVWLFGDVEVATEEKKQAQVRTVQIVCDGCGGTVRECWRCTVCFDHDVCLPCRESNVSVQDTCRFVRDNDGGGVELLS